MKILLIVFCLTATIVARIVTDEEWSKFKSTFGKDYKYPLEDQTRRSAFGDSLDVIDRYNKKNDEGKISFRCGVNKYADLDLGDFGMLGGLKQMDREEWANLTKDYASKPANLQGGRLPPYKNWADDPSLKAVQDQGEICGSCYSFATIGAIEAHNYIHNGGCKDKLSEQQLIDCSTRFGNDGCQGGVMVASYEYFLPGAYKTNGKKRKARGIMLANDYEYSAVARHCNYDKTKAHVFLARYAALPPDESIIKRSVATEGPVAIGMDATQSSFHFYKNGIYDDPSCNSTKNTHAVLIVGYGTQAGKNFWIIKNSWGPGWGMDGYAYILRNSENFCGIRNMASYPIINTRKNNRDAKKKKCVKYELVK